MAVACVLPYFRAALHVRLAAHIRKRQVPMPRTGGILYGRCPECLDFSSETIEEFETVVPPFVAVFQVHRAV